MPLERQNPQPQHHHRRKDAPEIGHRFGREAVDDADARERDVLVHGVHVIGCQELRRDDALRIEQRRHVHPHHADHTPEKLRVLEEGHGGGQQQAHARHKAQQAQHVEDEQQQRRSERRPGDQHDQKQRDDRQRKVDQRREDARYRVDVLGHVHLLDQRGVASDGGHAHADSLVEKVEEYDARKQIHRVIGNVALEQRGEHNVLNRHRQKRIEEAIPSAERLYFVLKSRETSWRMRKP